VSLHRTMRTISKRIARSEPVSTSSSSATHSVPPRSQSGGRGRGRLRQGSPKLTDTFGPRSPDWLDRRCHRRPARRSKTNTALSAMEPSTGAVRVSPVSETSRRCCPRGLTVTNAVAQLATAPNQGGRAERQTVAEGGFANAPDMGLRDVPGLANRQCGNVMDSRVMISMHLVT
jgi:hypothetical protein